MIHPGAPWLGNGSLLPRIDPDGTNDIFDGMPEKQDGLTCRFMSHITNCVALQQSEIKDNINKISVLASQRNGQSMKCDMTQMYAPCSIISSGL